MRVDTATAILSEIASELGGRVRERYYGRGMGNTCCLGITCDSPKTAQKMAARAGIRGASVDNMGLHYIVYWRSLNTTPVEAKP